MNKIREFSRSYIFLSLLYVAIGVVLVAWPSLSLTKIGYGLGVLLIVVGATCGIVYFTGDKKQEGFLQVELVVAIVCVALGVFVLLTPDFMSMILPFAMATVLLVGAIVKIQSAISIRKLYVRHWYVGLIAALIIIGLGIFLLVFPFATDAQMLLYIGICLILDGVTNLSGLFCIQIRTKKLANIQKKNPGVDVKALIEKEWEAADAAKAEKKAQKREAKRQKEQEIVTEAEEMSQETADDKSTADNIVSQSEKGETSESVATDSAHEGSSSLIVRAKAAVTTVGKRTAVEKEQTEMVGDTQRNISESADTLENAAKSVDVQEGGTESADAQVIEDEELI